MASFYSTTCVPSPTSGPANATPTAIPGLGVLNINDSSLADGATALINLYLGHAFSGDIISFTFYVMIVDNASQQTIINASLGGTNGLAELVNISTVYQIPANSQPQLQAYWYVEGTPGVEIFSPTIFSFSAQIFPTVADEGQ